MDWRLKCVALHALNCMPYALHGATKRFITGRYFLSVTDQELAAYQYHVRNFRGGRALEFGCGSDLLCALLLSHAGAAEILALDLARIASVEQVNHVIRQLRGRLDGGWPEIRNLDSDLERRYRIHYLAPADARETKLPANSVDFFCSTSTLEHIPAVDIARILLECRRLAKPDALYSFIIDYHDHYATSDSSITRVNFYRYSDRIWRFFNPPNHYQNRLRHSDFVRLFEDARLVPVEIRAIIPGDSVKGVALHRRFRSYSAEDLSALNGFFYFVQA